MTGCCALGWIFEIALAGLTLKAIDYGGGTDLWNVSKAKYVHFKEVNTQSPLNRLMEHRAAVTATGQEKTNILSCIALPRHRNYRSNRDVFYESIHRTPLSSPILPARDGPFSYLVEVRVFQRERWAIELFSHSACMFLKVATSFPINS